MKTIKPRLIVMSFLQFAVWGAYLTSMGSYLSRIGLGEKIGIFYAMQGIVSIFMPAIMGVIADRYVRAERLLGISHFIAAVAMFLTGYTGLAAAQAGGVPEFGVMFAFYSVSVAFYMPTIALSNSVSYSALTKYGYDTVKDFPPIRTFGTIGFICAMLLVNFSKLEGISFASVYSSDLQRAYQTAKIISKETKNIQIDPRLREWCLGSLEAEPTPIFLNEILSELNDISSEDLNLHLPEVCNAIHQIDTTGMTETFDGIACRLKECLGDIGYQTLNTDGGNVLIVTHAFIIKTIVHLFDYDKLKSISKIANTSVTKICFNGEQFVLEYSNMAY